MRAPVVFISYSHDSDDHKEWVRKLASDLRAAGIDVILDQWDLTLGADLAAFMERSITRSSRVLLICTEAYVQKADEGRGGVGYERLIVTGELVESIDTIKFLPILRNNQEGALPTFLGHRLYSDFRVDELYAQELESLLKDLHDPPISEKPPLGENPFSSTSSVGVDEGRPTTETGRTGGESILDGAWFEKEAAAARRAFDTLLENHARMELRFGLHSPISKSQLDLLNAARASEIRTFGWPIGVMLENREEYRPRPFAGGIRSVIEIAERGRTGVPSFDYWAFRENGDYYLLKSLFEDQRAENVIYFNTRIVRVAESLLYASKIYGNLGLADDTKLSIRVTHEGFAGRELSTSNLNRDIHRSVATDGLSTAELVSTVGSLRDEVAENVERILQPMFMLFDFKQFARPIYQDIIERFQRGEVS